MRHFDAAAIRAGLPWTRMLAALDAALKADVVAPLRAQHAIDVPGLPTASLLLMPAWRTGRRIGVKLVTVFPGNRERNQRAVAAVYALFDAQDGQVLALFDGEELTARRTAGASAYAAARLARTGARHLVMVGAGRLARGLIEAHRFVRPIDRVSLWSRTTAHAETAAAEMADAGLPVRACRDLEAAVRTADIVSCATLATAPIVRGAWLAPGTHLDLVGAFKPHMRETDDAGDAACRPHRRRRSRSGAGRRGRCRAGAEERRDHRIGDRRGIARFRAGRPPRTRARRASDAVQVGRFRARRPGRRRSGLRCATRCRKREVPMTWSILARDASGAFGIAIASRFFAVGALCPHARSGVGALATQALVNPLYGARGLDLLAQGTPPPRWCRRSPRTTPGATTASCT